MHFKPKYITFDCYGTLTNFRIAEVTRRIFSDRVSDDDMDRFLVDFSAYRRDEVLGTWKPYDQVLDTACLRTCTRWGLDSTNAERRQFFEAVPTWGPHADVPAPLKRIAKEIPLVILSNAMDCQIHSNVEKLEAPFHAVYTAEQAGAYKPRLQAFEYMLDQLGCGPKDILHVSSSLRYDLMAAHDMGIDDKVYVNRGFEPSNPAFGYQEIADISGLPKLVGLH